VSKLKSSLVKTMSEEACSTYLCPVFIIKLLIMQLTENDNGKDIHFKKDNGQGIGKDIHGNDTYDIQYSAFCYN
jgi:hypothetical protein